MRRLSLVIAAALLCAAAPPLDERWRIIGPGGGGSLYHPTVSPHDHRTAPSEEALGQPIGKVLNLINEKSGMSTDNEVLRVLKEKQIITMANHMGLITRDGREISVEHSAAPILAGEGKVIGVVLVFRDVAARRQEQVATAEQASL